MVNSPFQKLCCIQPVDGRPPFLLAASGPFINSFNLRDGSLLSQWPRAEGERETEQQEAPANGDEDRPAKRQRIDDGPADLSQNNSDDSIEFVSERKKGERRKPKIESSKLPNVSHLLVTSDATSVIAVTAEDKTLSVFDVRNEGILDLKNRRTMPKRVCAVVLTPDDKNLLVGDKFGDVYLLPLNPSVDWTPPKVTQDHEQKPYVPSATELTVHTKGNLEALRQQRERKASQPKKEGPDFECKLLLGHVSLLTDVVIGEVQTGLNRRQYILTSDRDEHIRVSRGVTQAHIIENYCLGHREFVSKLCLLPWDPTLVVSGSGEPSLKVYQWQSGRLLDEELFQAAVQKDIENSIIMDNGERSLDHLAVSNIWPVHYTVAGSAPRSSLPPHLILVALEGVPIILSYSLTDEGHLKHHQTLTLGGNVLDIAVGPALWQIVASIDTLHKPGSMKTLRPDETPAGEAFETFELFSNHSHETNRSNAQGESGELRWERSSLAMLLNSASLDCGRGEVTPAASSKDKGIYSIPGETLYGLESLRKRRGLAAAEAEAETEEAEAEGRPQEDPEKL